MWVLNIVLCCMLLYYHAVTIEIRLYTNLWIPYRRHIPCVYSVGSLRGFWINRCKGVLIGVVHDQSKRLAHTTQAAASNRRLRNNVSVQWWEWWRKDERLEVSIGIWYSTLWRARECEFTSDRKSAASVTNGDRGRRDRVFSSPEPLLSLSSS